MYFLKLNDNNFEFNTQNKCTISDIAIQEEKDSLKIVCEAANDSRLHDTLRISVQQESLNIQGRLDNLLEIGLGSVAEQGYEQLYWKFQLNI